MPRREPDYSRAAADTAAAAYLGSIAPELLSGRVTLYHGTSAKRAAKIRQEGLRPGAEPGIVEAMDSPRRGPPAVYLERSERGARGYGKQTTAIESVYGRALADAKKSEPLFAEQRAQAEIKNWGKDQGKRSFDAATHPGEVLKLRLPAWKYPTIDNPEVAGLSRGQFIANRGSGGGAAGGVSRAFDKLLKLAAYEDLKSNVVVPDQVGAERIVGHPSFAKLTRRELGEYIKHSPKRFGGGAAAALAVPFLAYDAIQSLRGRSKD